MAWRRQGCSLGTSSSSSGAWVAAAAAAYLRHHAGAAAADAATTLPAFFTDSALSIAWDPRCRYHDQYNAVHCAKTPTLDGLKAQVGGQDTPLQSADLGACFHCARLWLL